MSKYTLEINKLQSMINLLAEVMNVPAALIMRLTDDEIQVFLSSESNGNPYRIGDKEHFHNSGLYCERVIKTNNMLLVPNALEDNEWKNNPDVKLNMISYLGLPIVLPNGEPFGTICVLDDKTNHYSKLYIELLSTLRDFVEYHFLTLYKEISTANTKTLKAIVHTVMDLVNNTMNSMNFFLLKMQKGDSFNENDIDRFKNIIHNCAAKLKSLSEIKEVLIKEENFGDIIDFDS